MLRAFYYYYYYSHPWNESKSSGSISIKPKVTFLKSSFEELLRSGATWHLRVPGESLPVHCSGVPRSFPVVPGVARAVAIRKLAAVSC